MYTHAHTYMSILTRGHFLHCFQRERKRGEGEIDWLPSCMHPDRGWDPQPGYLPWLGIEPFGPQDDAPTNWITLAWANVYANIERTVSPISDLVLCPSTKYYHFLHLDPISVYSDLFWAIYLFYCTYEWGISNFNF